MERIYDYKKQNIAVIAVFLCMVFGMTIWTMVTPSREFSERENRALAQMPEASVESRFPENLKKIFETYLTDQFPMRDGWISAKTAIEKATLKTESKDIYFADDDYLIEAHSKSFTAPSANANIGYLKNFMETCGNIRQRPCNSDGCAECGGHSERSSAEICISVR